MAASDRDIVRIPIENLARSVLPSLPNRQEGHPLQMQAAALLLRPHEPPCGKPTFVRMAKDKLLMAATAPHAKQVNRKFAEKPGHEGFVPDADRTHPECPVRVLARQGRPLALHRTLGGPVHGGYGAEVPSPMLLIQVP